MDWSEKDQGSQHGLTCESVFSTAAIFYFEKLTLYTQTGHLTDQILKLYDLVSLHVESKEVKATLSGIVKPVSSGTEHWWNW